LTSFQSPTRAVGALDGEDVARLLAAAADVAVILDESGVVRDIAFGHNDLPKLGLADWLGHPFVETVTPESRPKLRELLADCARDGAARPREVTHPVSSGISVPMRYAVARVGRDGRMIALGQDLRVVGRLQQRLVELQNTLGAENLRARFAETRFRLIFQTATDATLLVDGNGYRILDANPAALVLLGATAGATIGSGLPSLLATDDLPVIHEHLATARAAGKAEPVTCQLSGDGRPVSLVSTLMRQGKGVQLLVRLSVPGQRLTAPVDSASQLATAALALPEALVVVDRNQIVVEANAAFLALASIGNESLARGHPLSRWLGRQGVDMNVLASNLREHGVVRGFVTLLRGEHGGEEEVEITAVTLTESGQPLHAFLIRSAAPVRAADGETRRELPHSVERITELVGRVPLKDLVRDTTDVIEKLCIEAALKLTGDNRASAAQMLGLSRQSLYAKLRRYGFDAQDEEEGGDEA
jgi:transcriptional regulator PpsR